MAGRPELKDYDSRRWQNNPHLWVSLEYLGRILDYVASLGIRMYRISSNIAPYITHPELPQFHRQLDECRNELVEIGAKARRLDIRLSTHPAQFIVLNSPDEQVYAATLRDFAYHAELFDALGATAEAKFVTHVGGVYGDRAAAADRFVERYGSLPERQRQRLVLENDEVSWSAEDVLAIHGRTGVPLVFDNLHHHVNNPSGLAATDAIRAFSATWPAGQVPKIHFSSQRHAERVVSRRNRATGTRIEATLPAKAGQHDDWVESEEFIALIGAVPDLAFDIMLEAKQKELALLRLREELAAAGRENLAW